LIDKLCLNIEIEATGQGKIPASQIHNTS